MFVSFVILDPAKFTTKANHQGKHGKYVNEEVWLVTTRLYYTQAVGQVCVWAVAG